MGAENLIVRAFSKVVTLAVHLASSIHSTQIHDPMMYMQASGTICADQCLLVPPWRAQTSVRSGEHARGGLRSRGKAAARRRLIQYNSVSYVVVVCESAGAELMYL
jgi:hypothetical protein